MSAHLFMGAINKLSNERESPLFANKKDNYMCPDCNRDVIFKKGKIKKAHFAHKASEIKCTFYDKPSETQIQGPQALQSDTTQLTGCVQH